VESEQAVAANTGTLVRQLLVGMSDASVERFTVVDAKAAAREINGAKDASERRCARWAGLTPARAGATMVHGRSPYRRAFLPSLAATNG